MVRTWTDLPDMMLVEEAAEYMRISMPKARQLVKSGELPTITIGRHYRVPKIKLAKMLGM
jgi:excisionase family DNA binding protein